MADPTPTEKLAEQLRVRANEYASLDVDKLTRKDLGKDASFEVLQESFLAFQDFAKRMAQCTWKGLPMPVIQTCYNKLDELKNVLTSIQTFNLIRSGNPSGERNSFITNFDQRWAETYNYISPHLCFAESVDMGSGTFKQTLANVLNEANAAKEKFQKQISDHEAAMVADQERIKRLAENIEKMGQQSGVTNQAVHFKTLADNYGWAAFGWLTAAFATGLGLYFYVRDIHEVPNVSTTVALAALYMPRLITVTLLSTALIFFIRNFSATMHNKTVNRHRQTALTTFKTFVSSTEDPGTKNAVLVQATQAIFAPQPSGYLKTDQEMPQMNQVTEIVRGVTGKDQK